MARPHFFVAEVNGSLVAEADPGDTGLFHGGSRRSAPSVVEHVPDRLIGDRFDLGDNLRNMLVEFIVDQDDAVRRAVDGDVAATADDHVQVEWSSSLA